MDYKYEKRTFGDLVSGDVVYIIGHRFEVTNITRDEQDVVRFTGKSICDNSKEYDGAGFGARSATEINVELPNVSVN